MIDTMLSKATECSICEAEIDLDAGDIQGDFGITPVAFCVWCYSSIVDMVKQLVVCWCENRA